MMAFLHEDCVVQVLAYPKLLPHSGPFPVPEGDIDTSGDRLTEVAGRACYWSYGKGRKTNGEYLSNILASGHGSVLEHATWTIGISGISRALSHELVRHRHLSFSQLSQRFVTEAPEFVVPPLLLEPGHEADVLAFEQACSAASSAYQTLLALLPDNKQGREAARAVLPNATATRIVVTGNARAWRHLLALRGSKHADAEFRRLAYKLGNILKILAPNIFQDVKLDQETGTVTVEKGSV